MGVEGSSVELRIAFGHAQTSASMLMPVFVTP